MKSPRPTETQDTIERLEPLLQIDENGLDEALISQPDAYYRVSRLLTLQISRRDAAKQLVEEAEAEADLEIRSRAQKADQKITENEIKSKKILDEDVKHAESELLALNRSVGQLQALKEAFTQRGYALKSLADLYIANYYSTNSSNSMSSHEVRDRKGQEGRVAMDRARKEKQ